MYEALLLYLLSVPVKVVVNAAGNEVLRRTKVRDTVGTAKHSDCPERRE